MKIWVTRDEDESGPMSAALRAVGLEPVVEPVVTRHVLADVTDQIRELGSDDWLVLTSAYAIEQIALSGASGAARTPRVAVVGEPSRRVAETASMRVELVGAGGAAGLFSELAKLPGSATVCYPRAAQAQAPQLPTRFRVVSPVLYETVPRDFSRDITERVDAAAVTSPSAVRAIGRSAIPMASIGASTSQALRALGVEPWVQAPEPSFPALARAIADQPNPSRQARA